MAGVIQNVAIGLEIKGLANKKSSAQTGTLGYVGVGEITFGQSLELL